MEDYEKIIDKVSDCACTSFWITCRENTKDFPDTDDADCIKEVIIERGLALLITQWLYVFPSEERKEELDRFVKILKMAEEQIRGHEITYPDDE